MFTCPECGKEQHDPIDASEGYCDNCEAYTGSVQDCNHPTLSVNGRCLACGKTP